MRDEIRKGARQEVEVGICLMITLVLKLGGIYPCPGAYGNALWTGEVVGKS